MTDDLVGKPKHYFAGSFECGEIVDALRPRWTSSGLDPHRLASAFEYLFRCGSKDNPRQDAEKALNYLHRALYGRWFPFNKRDAAQEQLPPERADVEQEPSDKIWTINPSGPSPLAEMVGTHWENCGWSGDKRHYQCLLGDAQHLRDERDEARARLAELEPLVAEVVAPWVADGTHVTTLSSPLRALVLHERRRAAKETK